MKSKKIIQNIALALTIASIGSVVLPNLASAKSLDKPTQTNIEISSEKTNVIISQSLINKATPFVKITQNRFYLSKEGYSALSSDEIKVVSSYIDNTNTQLEEILNNNNLTQNGNKFVVSVKDTKASSTIRSYAVSSSYMNIEYTWWGARVYFSHQAVSDLNDFLVGAGTAGGIGQFFAKKGLQLASGYLASISLFGTPIAWAMSKVDKGKGVYLNCVMYVPCTIDPA